MMAASMNDPFGNGNADLVGSTLSWTSLSTIAGLWRTMLCCSYGEQANRIILNMYPVDTIVADPTTNHITCADNNTTTRNKRSI